MKIRTIAAIFATLFLSGCGAANSWLAETTADKLPHWMGGLPNDAPPRPHDPRYRAYIEKQRNNVDTNRQSEASNDEIPRASN